MVVMLYLCSAATPNTMCGRCFVIPVFSSAAAVLLWLLVWLISYPPLCRGQGRHMQAFLLTSSTTTSTCPLLRPLRPPRPFPFSITSVILDDVLHGVAVAD